MSEIEFISELDKLGIKINEEQLQQLNEYYNLIIEWNEKINLTRIVKKEEVYLKHFYDSVTLIKAIDLNNKLKICDIGTGAGFPGIVLKIMFPNLEVTLIDSLDKRIKFLNEVIRKLDLSNIIAIHYRGEDYVKNHRNYYDLITCRAVSKLNIISEICLPGVKVGGYFIPMKANIDDEINDTNYLKVLNSVIEKIITFNLPYEDSVRNLIVIKRVGDIPLMYPREYDKIIKRSI